jgi:hypothetical protein
MRLILTINGLNGTEVWFPTVDPDFSVLAPLLTSSLPLYASLAIINITLLGTLIFHKYACLI